MREALRTASKKGMRYVLDWIDHIKEEKSPSAFPNAVSMLRTYAPRQSQLLFAGGPQDFGNLVWARRALLPVSLERELQWAAAWLSGHGGRIARHRAICDEIQRQHLIGNHATSVQLLDRFMNQYGWSLWGVELRCAIGQRAYGAIEQGKWSSALQQSVPNSIPGLLLHIFSDRNDEKTSYDSFYAKCSNSFERYRAVAEWLPTYLKYRALAVGAPAKKTYPVVLSRDITSSLFDYYEGMVSALVHICNDDSDTDLRDVATQTIRTLLNAGHSDHRLKTILVALTGENVDTDEEDRPSIQLQWIVDALSGRASAESSDLPEPIDGAINGLRECQEDGIAAESGATTALKYALNHKSLDVGLAIGMGIGDAITDVFSQRIWSLERLLLTKKRDVEDVVCLPDEAGRRVLTDYAQGARGGSEELARRIAAVLDVPGATDWPTGPCLMLIWIARQLLILDRTKDARKVADHLSTLPKQWKRFSAKIAIWVSIKENDFEEGLRVSAEWIERDPAYVTELPIADLLRGREWTELKHIDPVLTGLVAHHVHVSTKDRDDGWLCKMACRSFDLHGYRARLAETYESVPFLLRPRFLNFLRDVWIDQNLSLIHRLNSTDRIREDRMEVLQFLLQRDSSCTSQYVEEIKELTFESTLSQGLLRINQSRVFVNETGINRWAERELQQDYDRWRQLCAPGGAPTEVAGLLKQLFIDPKNESILEALCAGQPTEADAILADLIARLFERFLTDPTDGLDCYLSLRIRHGSLRGTLFGPLEENGLFYSGTQYSLEMFRKRWIYPLNLLPEQEDEVVRIMQDFTEGLKKTADELVNGRIQIRSRDKPMGFISNAIAADSVRQIGIWLRVEQAPLGTFAQFCYFVFWRAIESGLRELAAYVSLQIKPTIQQLFEDVSLRLRRVGVKTVSLTNSLTSVSTATQAQLDAIAEWFRLPGKFDDERFTLSVAIKIASAYTKNVHRGFAADVKMGEMPANELSLTTLALAVLGDALFVVFDNAYRHSGLGSDTGPMHVDAIFDAENRLLSITVSNLLAESVEKDLLSGRLDALRCEYDDHALVMRANREGGSGFAKLMRLTRYVDTAKCPEPFAFGIIARMWYTKITICLRERDGAYDALQ